MPQIKGRNNPIPLKGATPSTETTVNSSRNSPVLIIKNSISTRKYASKYKHH